MSVQLEDAGEQYLALLERRPHRAVQAVLQVQVALPLHDVREEVAVEGRVLGEEGLEVELLLGRHELIEADRARRDVRPLPGALPAVVGVRPAVSDALEDHTESLPVKTFRAQPWRRSATLKKTPQGGTNREPGVNMPDRETVPAAPPARGGPAGSRPAPPGRTHPRVFVPRDAVLAAHAGGSQHAHERSVVRLGDDAY